MWMLPRDEWGPYENAAPIDHLDLAGEVQRWSGVRTAGTHRPRRRGGAVMTTFAAARRRLARRPDRPTVRWSCCCTAAGPNEADIIALADHLPDGPAYAAVRAPIAEGGGYAWFANRGIGRPVAESLAETMTWFRTWLDDAAPAGRPVVLVGFSG